MKMNNYVVIDIETSGLDEENDEIIRLSALKIKNGEISEKFSSFCKPKKPLLKEMEILTGITNADLNEKPQIIDLLPDFLTFIGNETIVSHNVGFDLKFINAALEKANMPPIKNETVDIYVLAKEKCELESYALYSIAEALEISGRDGSYPEVSFRVYEKLKNIPDGEKVYKHDNDFKRRNYKKVD